jgi:heptosyltransferase-2
VREDFIDEAGGGGVAIGSKYEPVPTIDYYLELAKYLGGVGADNPSRAMELAVTEAERAEGHAALAQLKIENQSPHIEHFVVLVPGANFGSSKCWPPERFAALAAALADPAGQFRTQVVVATSPSELPIAQAIQEAVPAHRERVQSLADLNDGRGVSVGALKEIVRRSRLMICNDTGPRHFAAAFGVPTVTLFGPTDPVWAETYSEKETIVRVPVACSPCQLKRCPIDHRCMKGIGVEMVVEAVRERWGK